MSNIDTRPNLYEYKPLDEARVSRYFTDIVGLQAELCEEEDPLIRNRLYCGTNSLVKELVMNADITATRGLVADAFAQLGGSFRGYIFTATKLYFLRSTNLDQAWPSDSIISDRQARNFLGMPQK